MHVVSRKKQRALLRNYIRSRLSDEGKRGKTAITLIYLNSGRSETELTAAHSQNIQMTRRIPAYSFLGASLGDYTDEVTYVARKRGYPQKLVVVYIHGTLFFFVLLFRGFFRVRSFNDLPVVEIFLAIKPSIAEGIWLIKRLVRSSTIARGVGNLKWISILSTVQPRLFSRFFFLSSSTVMKLGNVLPVAREKVFCFHSQRWLQRALSSGVSVGGIRVWSTNSFPQWLTKGKWPIVLIESGSPYTQQSARFKTEDPNNKK